MKNVFYLLLFIIFAVYACDSSGNQSDNTDSTALGEKEVMEDIPVTTSIEILSIEALELIDSTSVVEELGKGFLWAEGPVWVESINALLFTDVPENTIYKWSEKDGLSVFLTPSGFTDTSNVEKGDGANGLMLDSEGDLLLCQHGDRRIASLKSGMENPKAEFITLVDKIDGKRFNSPNDLVIKSNGDIYFTDPPYGIKDEKDKELSYNGVYKLSQNGEVSLMVDSITRPNGIVLSLDEKTIYVNNSDPDKVFIYSYTLDSKGNFTKPSIFFDATEYTKSGKGLPDGIKTHKSGNLFATGPGGVLIISPKGKLLGIIRTSKSTANCAFDKDYKYLYLTTTDRLLRVKLK